MRASPGNHDEVFTRSSSGVHKRPGGNQGIFESGSDDRGQAARRRGNGGCRRLETGELQKSNSLEGGGWELTP